MTDILYPILGGLCIGLSASIYLLATGKIMGISGLLSQALFGPPGMNTKWLPLIFLVGTVVGGASYGVLTHQTVPFPDPRSPLLLITSGLLVGYGTRLGSGCTSGHGVCGISRGSIRSLTATAIFMVTAILTVMITK
ncbi:YeeE/YedE family protein [Marinomonas spartinae]|uniref:YeeE/YedE family protein n=1 Tax=Marinomonas spartinae TaxID=1792290 RepID=UPI0018F14DA5|nr:YeeE/YedE thiosulfate transporter family protein [Marinomonas spartinae]MBJ7554074.1 YeeE/YedE family protein [Marinomonas spartinae]